MSVRRGGVGFKPGRVVIQAGVICLAALGCAADPPPALLTLIDPEQMALQDSELLPDSAKAAIRSYLSRVEDSIWGEVKSPEMARLVGQWRGLTAMLNSSALPADGRTVRVMIEVPEVGFTEFRLARVRTDNETGPTYVGEARRGAMSILLLRDTVVAGRITTADGVFNFRSGRYGLINVAPIDTTGTLPELHLIHAPQSADTIAMMPRRAVAVSDLAYPSAGR